METGLELIMTVQNSIPPQSAGAGSATGSPAYRAARETAAWFSRAALTRLRLSGTDRITWLQGLVTNDVAALRPGSGCYAAYLTPQGRMITDLRILALDDALLVDLPASTAGAVAERFDMFIITEDVTVEDVTPTIARVCVYGPAATTTLAVVLGPDAFLETPGEAPQPSAALAAGLAALEEHACRRVRFLSQAWPDHHGLVLLAATRELGVEGFDVCLPASMADWFRERLLRADVPEGDDQTWNTLRIEAGTPLFGSDMDEDTIPLEAGIESQAISFTKGCYVGQEIIIRVMHRGQGRVAKKLVRLAATGAPSTVLSPGATLQVEDGTRDVGRVTSAAWSPSRGRWIGLGYVHREFLAPGTPLLASHDGTAGRVEIM